MSEKKFDPAKPVQTRDGKKARILATDLEHVDGRTIVAAINTDGQEMVFAFNPDGTCGYANYDLVNIRTKREGWVNVYPGYTVGGIAIHKTKDDALKNAASDCLASIRIEWEEP